MVAENSDYDMLLNIGHAHVNGWDIPKLIDTPGSRLRGFHFHDNDGSCDSHMPVGSGTADYNGIFDAIRRSANSADFIVEYALQYGEKILDGMALIKSRLYDKNEDI